MLFSSLLQIIYDEGPLYVFAKSDQIRKHWINELKNGQYVFKSLSQTPFKLASPLCGLHYSKDKKKSMLSITQHTSPMQNPVFIQCK